MTLGRLRDCDRGGSVLRELLHLREERRVLGHQPVGGQDLGLLPAPSCESGLGQAPELLGDLRERRPRTVALCRATASAVRGLGLHVPNDEHAPDRDPARSSETAEHLLAHDSFATVAASAPRISAVDVAPGS